MMAFDCKFTGSRWPIFDVSDAEGIAVLLHKRSLCLSSPAIYLEKRWARLDLMQGEKDPLHRSTVLRP